MVKFRKNKKNTTNSESDEQKSKCDCSAFNICKFFCHEPEFILKVLLVVINLFVVLYIIAGNTLKLNSSVHATLTSLRVNQSLHYPSVTICQHPALRNINMSKTRPESRLLMIKSAQLNKKAMQNYSTISLIYGQCSTLVPQSTVDNVGKRFGYAINLTYVTNSVEDYKSLGWHVFIHESTHKFDDHCIDDGRADYFYMPISTEMHVKLQAKQFQRNGYCRTESQVEQCYRKCFEANSTTGDLGCLGAVITNRSYNFDDCQDDKLYKMFLNGSLEENLMNRTECACPKVCRLTLYEAFLEQSTAVSTEITMKGQLLIYFTNKRYLHVREKEIYEWPQYFADLCAVIAFCIGVSMMSIFNIVYKFISMACCSQASLPDSVKSAIAAGSRKQSTVF
uniref:CSON000535 protein n=1 Tax=Culicoides sonorensis TaxID=179676 RepID=A0A336MIR3_CULSO